MKKSFGTASQGLFGATLGFFIGFAAIALFSTTVHLFKDSMQLTPVMIGLLVATPTLSGSLLRIPFSAWVDTTGGKKPLLVLLGLSILGIGGLTLVVVALYPEHLSPGLYPLLIVLGILSGCGVATFAPGISQVSYWFPKDKQGSALGAYGGMGGMAPGIFTLVLPVALSTIGLAKSYLTWMVLLIAGSVAYSLVGRNAPYFQLLARKIPRSQAKQKAEQAGQEMFPLGSTMDSLRASTRAWQTWALIGIYFITQGGFLALTTWLPTYWHTYFATSVVLAGVLAATFTITAALIRIPGGGISDRIGGENTVLLALTTLVIGATLMTLSHHFGLSVLGELLIAFGMGIGNAAVFKLVPQNVPHAIGGASGWVGGLGAFGGFIIPPVLGEFVHWQGSSGYATGFSIFIGMAVIAMALARVLKRAREKSNASG
jgi:NNP family nitrate/nitrite transporter-like MFS transporter